MCNRQILHTQALHLTLGAEPVGDGKVMDWLRGGGQG